LADELVVGIDVAEELLELLDLFAEVFGFFVEEDGKVVADVGDVADYVRAPGCGHY
jgi:hypothetical protein